jgi:DNA-binding IclR family transcriptional regulator
VLNLLRKQERNVGELAGLCGFTAANISRHLALMTQHGFVVREIRGTSV